MNRITFLAMACLSLAACGPSREMIQMQSQMDKLQPQQADLSATLSQIRQEIAVIRGELDDAKSVAADMKRDSDAVGGFAGIDAKIAAHQQALDRIFTELSMNLPDSDPEGAAATAPAADAAGALTAQGRPDTPAPKPETEKTASVAAVPMEEKTKTATAGKAPDAVENAKLLYQQGYAYYTQNKFKESLASFNDFTKTYPESDLISSAWFWKGQSYFALKRYSAAVLAYETIISTYPKSNKAPLAYLRQGMGFSRLGNTDAAKVRLNELIRMFPGSPEAKRAKSFLSTMK